MNENHPELLKGEIFLTNISIGDYHIVGIKTKRCGVLAYSKEGDVINGLVPVFVMKKEYDKHIEEAKKSYVRR